MLKNAWDRGGLQVLCLLTLINLFNYLDRYILVALLPTIKRELSLSDVHVGLLATAFMITYFATAPLFGWLGDRGPRYRLISGGVAVWSVATALSGIARNFAGILGARLAIGVGEAAYGSISPSILTDQFPKKNRGRVLAIFFMAIPVGSALGFLLGGLLEKLYGWRSAFFVVGLPGLFLALTLLFLRDPQRGQQDEEEDRAAKSCERPMEVIRALAAHRGYVLTVAGYCAYTFVLGGIAVWIPHYIERYMDVDAASGNMAFGAITVIAGLFGTLIGGAWGDRWAKTGTDAYLKLSALSMFAAVPVYFLILRTDRYSHFCVFTFILEFLLFLSTSPINAEIVNCVSPHIRSSANAMGIFMIHLFGDALSPTLIGYISDRSNLRFAMMLFLAPLFAAGVIWSWKVIAHFSALPWPAQAFDLPPSQCHRGYHPTGVQENTLEAFRLAKEQGAAMVELDVRLSLDNVPVVVHDEDLQRISGKAGLVNALTAEELFIQAKVPTLRRVLNEAATQKLLVNIEIKSDSAASSPLESQVAMVVRETQMAGAVLFSSFNPLSLRRLARKLPGVPRALLVGSEPTAKNRFYLRKMYLAFWARPHLVHLEQALYTVRLAQAFQVRKVPVAVWTVEDSAKARKFLEMGAKSIISSDPGIL